MAERRERPATAPGSARCSRCGTSSSTSRSRPGIAVRPHRRPRARGRRRVASRVGRGRRSAWWASPAAASRRCAARCCASRSRHSGERRVRGPRHHARCRGASCARCAPDADDLPGPLRVAQPAQARRADRRRPDAPARHRVGRGAAARGAGACSSASASRPSTTTASRTSSPADSASASASRARSALRAAADRRRRAGLGARRVDPGADHQPAEGPAGESSSLTYVFVAHDLGVVRHVSDRIAVMYLGQGRRGVSRRGALHEAAPSLHASRCCPRSRCRIPRENAAREPLVLEGDVPSPIDPPPACRFHTRCPRATEICTAGRAAARRLRQRPPRGLPPPGERRRRASWRGSRVAPETPAERGNGPADARSRPAGPRQPGAPSAE